MLLDSYESPDAQELLLARETRLARGPVRREQLTNAIGAVSFLSAAGLLAALAPWQRTLSISNLALVLAVWFLVERVRFPVGSAWTYPTMLVFVPALFLLPAAIVPLVAAGAMLLRAAPELAARRVSATMLPAFIADAWFTIGPALVIVLSGTGQFRWIHWPYYLLALLAQMLCDFGATTAWSRLGEGVSVRVTLPSLSWTYLVDAGLAPLGLLIAAAAVVHPPLVLIALSPVVMMVAFARERRERMDQSLELSTAYRGTALLLGDVVGAADHYTGIHSREVVDLALAVADALGLDATCRRNVEFAALLHDVGKIRIPNEIINKPGELDDAEWEIVRRHTIDGENMLRQVGGILSSIGRFVRFSHERYDGLGYPDGLRGEEIPIEARIVSACDAFSAMTTDRAYRQAMPMQDALEELHRCAGTQFDPDVAKALAGLVRTRYTALDPCLLA